MTILDQLVQRREGGMPRLIDRLSRVDGLMFQSIAAVAGPRVLVNGRWVLNFTASNYLGFGQDSRVAAAMAQTARDCISLGMPRALGSAALTTRVETAIAGLVGQEHALVFPSTNHVAHDVLALLAGESGLVFVDRHAYPISLDAALATTGGGERLLRFPHNDAKGLERLLQAHASVPEKVIVCDGIYPIDGQMAKLREFAMLAERYGAAIYVDDAHGVGMLGDWPSAAMPFGYGGGGTPHRLGLEQGSVVHVGGLSKALGVPVAFVAGPWRFIEYLRLTAGAFVHSSPPATPILAAALAALRVHDQEGDDRRRRLVSLVRRFRGGLTCAGLVPEPASLFPVQSLCLPSAEAATSAAIALRRRGIWPLLQLAPPDQPSGGALRFVLIAVHEPGDIDEAVGAIAQVWRSLPEAVEGSMTFKS
ncbi:MAG: pyridoxal phosphate-dependent aminotransferase family protein [Chloroflexota bacterium]|nr:pyridoxal phosphate-dependent aminotransferase family protein [Chloroflexota bacterium]